MDTRRHPAACLSGRPRGASRGLAGVALAGVVALAAAGCDRGDLQEVLGEVRPWPGPPDPVGILIPFQEFRDEVGNVAATERRVLIKSAEAYQSYFGHAPPAGVNLPDEWVIFYSAGTRPSGGFSASIRQLMRISVGQQGTLRAVTRLQSPGRGCVVTDALTTPHVLVKFKAQPGSGTIDFFRDDVSTSCVDPAGNPCAVTLCPAGTECVILKSNPPQAQCVPIPTNPCSTVRCQKGFHCEARDVVCVRAPCPPVAECVADGPRCGGIAGIRCPGAGSCEDDPSDSCDPRRGGADCGGLCQCRAVAACIVGHKWDPSPSVCACVPDQPGTGPTCGKTTCPAGQLCCNSSCGICTPPGGACIQIACAN